MRITVFAKQLLLATGLFLTGVLSAAEVSIKVLDSDEKPVSGIVVYITGDNLMDTYQGRQVTIYQEDKKFSPYITVKTPVDRLVFENRDTISHHVFTVLSKELNFRLKKDERFESENITNLGDALLACNIHDWMAGYVFTVDTPYFGKSDANGVIALTVPERENLTATIWHPQLHPQDQSQSQTFNVQSTSSLTFQLTETMAEIPSQDSEKIFDFLDDYE